MLALFSRPFFPEAEIYDSFSNSQSLFSANLLSVQLQDFRAPKADEVCYMEAHNSIQPQPPTRRHIKYHLTIVDLSFSSLYNYTIETEFAVNYQNCSLFQEEDSLEVKIERRGLACIL